jgi:hypothetical protein
LRIVPPHLDKEESTPTKRTRRAPSTGFFSDPALEANLAKSLEPLTLEEIAAQARRLGLQPPRQVKGWPLVKIREFER